MCKPRKVEDIVVIIVQKDLAFNWVFLVNFRCEILSAR